MIFLTIGQPAYLRGADTMLEDVDAYQPFANKLVRDWYAARTREQYSVNRPRTNDVYAALREWLSQEP